ncbi:hypothetical protein ES703_26043 [subsurface metagenome]
MIKIAGLSALAKKEITLYGSRFALASLDAEEQGILENNFNTLLGTTDSQVRKILEQRIDTIVAGIMAIKDKLNNRKFRGMNPADMEIGFGFIRPQFVRYAGDEKTDWDVVLSGMAVAAAALEYDRWLDSDGGIAFVLPEDFGLIITHLVSQVTPEPLVRGVHFQIGRINLIPEEVSDIMLGDNENGIAVYPIPTKIVLPEDELLATVIGHEGTEYLKLGGLVVGLGRILKAEIPSWEE